MREEPTTAVVQRYLDALAGDAPAEPIVRELLERAAYRLERLCATMLHRRYPRLTGPPTNLETAEMLGGVVEGLLKAMRSIRPQTVRQFFALANQHMRWQLNDLARRLDERPAAVELREGLLPRRMRGNPGLLVRNGERRGQDERTHGQEEHRQDGAGDEVTTSNQLYHGRMSTRHA